MPPRYPNTLSWGIPWGVPKCVGTINVSIDLLKIRDQFSTSPRQDFDEISAVSIPTLVRAHSIVVEHNRELVQEIPCSIPTVISVLVCNIDSEFCQLDNTTAKSYVFER